MSMSGDTSRSVRTSTTTCPGTRARPWCSALPESFPSEISCGPRWLWNVEVPSSERPCECWKWCELWPEPPPPPPENVFTAERIERSCARLLKMSMSELV